MVTLRQSSREAGPRQTVRLSRVVLQLPEIRHQFGLSTLVRRREIFIVVDSDIRLDAMVEEDTRFGVCLGRRVHECDAYTNGPECIDLGRVNTCFVIIER